MRGSPPLLVSQVVTTGLTVVIAFILLASNFTIINAQQQVQSDGGLTATLNGSSFTTGDTITVSGTVEERDPNSNVLIRVIDPQSNEVEAGLVDITADNTFTYSFVAGEQEEEFDFDEPMVTSGNYRMIVSYITPDLDTEEVELTFAYNNTAATLPAEPEAVTTTNQPPPVQGTTTLFQSVNDSFSVQVPDGWIIHDLENTGSALLEEATQGYGILAQLCPEDHQQGSVPILPNVSGGSSGGTQSCEGSENDVIHIVRYHDLDTRLPATNNVTTTTSSNNNNIMTNDNILSYHLQKLQEVGYSDIEIVNDTDTAVNLTNPLTNQTIATVPAKTVEMTYNTNFAPSEARSGYLISTASNATAPNPGMTKGYTIFYEGSSLSSAEPTIEFGSLRPPPPAVGQILDSFQLIAAPEVAQELAQQQAAQAAQPAEGVEDDVDDDAEDNGDDDGDNGGGDEEEQQEEEQQEEEQQEEEQQEEEQQEEEQQEEEQQEEEQQEEEQQEEEQQEEEQQEEEQQEEEQQEEEQQEEEPTD